MEYKNLPERLKSKAQWVNLRIKQLLEMNNKDYENFVHMVEVLLQRFKEDYFYLSHLNSVDNTDQTQKAWEESLPIINEFYNDLNQNEEMYVAYKEVLDREKDENRRRYLKETLRGFELNGIGLEKEIKDEIKNINESLSKLSTEFSKNVLKDTKKFKLEITDPNSVKEFPESELKNHQVEENKWVFTLLYPSYSAYMKWGSSSDVRKKFYLEKNKVGKDNESIIKDILTLRNRKAKILGLKDYSELSLEFKIAKDSDQIFSFLEDLRNPLTSIIEKEDKELIEYVKSINPEYKWDSVQPWDKSYYINKLKKEKFDYNEDKIKQYFELNRTLENMLEILSNMFSLKFKKIKENSKVKTFKIWKVNNFDHKYLGEIHFDLETRESKRGGAWFNNLNSTYKIKGNINYSENFIVANFQQAKDGKSYLTHDNVVTLFHEMGHAMQNFCSEEDDITFSGIDNIEWDGVEWSSQFLEKLPFQREILKIIGKNDNNETISDSDIDKIIELDKFRIGNYLNRQIELSMFDMNLHIEENSDLDYSEILKLRETIKDRLNIKTHESDRFQNSFSHIFSGGYAAGYYSYLFSELFSIDSFLEFKKGGIFNSENCKKWYNSVLKRGSKLTTLEMYKLFTNKEMPESTSILAYYDNKSFEER